MIRQVVCLVSSTLESLTNSTMPLASCSRIAHTARLGFTGVVSVNHSAFVDSSGNYLEGSDDTRAMEERNKCL